MSLFRLPVAIQPHVMRSKGVTIYYPRVVGLPDRTAEERMNRAIDQAVLGLQQEQMKAQTGTNLEMTGHFEIKTNERAILSLILTNYAYSYPMAHGNTVAKSLTFDVNTGNVYPLSSLFKPGSDYVARLSAIVAAQIKQRDLPLLNGFQSISPNQSYYLADKALILYFALYEITPYYVGLPMFPISVYDVLSIATEQGPLDKLAVDVA